MKVKDGIVWANAAGLKSLKFTCGHCGSFVGSDKGFVGKRDDELRSSIIYICPACSGPNFFDTHGERLPAIRFGREVKWITDPNIEAIYNEARDVTSVGAYTAAVMVCRKILMNIAVQKGALQKNTFEFYVNFLADKGYVPPDAKPWVDQIRKKGNDANHEIDLMTEEDAKLIINFTEMILKFIYEMPGMLKNVKSLASPAPVVGTINSNASWSGPKVVKP